MIACPYHYADTIAGEAASLYNHSYDDDDNNNNNLISEISGLHSAECEENSLPRHSAV
jgi:hypothetical protein